MLNQSVLVGRIANNPIIDKENNKAKITLKLAVPRSYKNVNGEYDTDIISCTLYDNIAQATTEYCKKGDLIGIKGRTESRKIKPEEQIEYVTELIADKVTFLSNGDKQ